ncbi:MAG: hypothetical protein NTV25_04815 [Methanothrix sp.]|nr:hypothetical protein [Methanothrix sp.]
MKFPYAYPQGENAMSIVTPLTDREYAECFNAFKKVSVGMDGHKRLVIEGIYAIDGRRAIGPCPQRRQRNRRF